MTSLASMKQKIHLLNAIIKLGIAYAYYAVHFSKPDIKKLENVISKLTKKICSIPKSMTNILTHLPHKGFGIKPTSLLFTRLHKLDSKQLLHALNDQGQLGQIYQGITKHIIANFGRSLHLLHLKYQACLRSPIAQILYMLEREYKIYMNTKDKTFP